MSLSNNCTKLDYEMANFMYIKNYTSISSKKLSFVAPDISVNLDSDAADPVKMYDVNS